MKKLLALVLSLLMVFTIIPAAVMSANAETQVGESVKFYFGAVVVSNTAGKPDVTANEILTIGTKTIASATKTTMGTGGKVADDGKTYSNYPWLQSNNGVTSGQYVEFTTPVNVDSGVYDVSFATRAASSGRSLLDVEINGNKVGTDIDTNNKAFGTPGYYSVPLSSVTLTSAGTLTIKVTAKSTGNMWLGNIILTKTADYSSTDIPDVPDTPTDIEHITVSTDDFYLPDADTLTESGKKVVCYTDSNGDIVPCSSLAVNGETYDAVTVNIDQLSGAQMRLNNVNGLRFLSEVDTSDITNLTDKSIEIYEIGTKIAPSDYFTDSSKTESSFLFVKASGFYKEEADKCTIAGSIVAIKDQNLAREFSGQGYLKVKLPDNTIVTVNAVMSNDSKRSVYKVASMAYKDASIYSAAQLAVIKGYLDAVVIIENGAIVVPDGYTSPYNYTDGKIVPNKDIIQNIDGIRLAVINNTKYYASSADHPISNIVSNTVPEAPTTGELTMKSFTLKVTGYDGSKFDENAVLILPASYSETGEKTRLIIDCHGFTGSSAKLAKAFNGDATFSASGEYYQNLLYFAHQGYAVLEVDGGGSTFGPKSMGNINSVNGNVAAYEYCINNFNLKTEVLVKGSSMGGIVSQNLVTSGKIPVLAYVGESPVTSLYRQAFCEGWDNDCIKFIARRYNFDFSNTGYQESTFPYTGKSKKVSDAERQLFVDNFTDKIASVNGIWKYCSSFYDYENKEFKEGYTNFLTETDSTKVDEMYSSISIDFPVPLKIFHGTNDQSVSCKYSEYFTDAINRGKGQKAELVKFETSTHLCLGTLQTITCKDGTKFEVMSSYDSMLQFFKQYDI